MIELTWGQVFRNQQLNMAMQKLSNTTVLDFKTVYHIARIVSKLDQAQREADGLFQKLLAKHGDKDDKGNYTIPEEKRTEFDKEFDEFKATVFTIDKNKLNLSDLSGVGLTAAEILVLEPYVFTMEAIEGGNNGQEESKKSS